MIKKVLVTGGAGYIGSHTVRRLLKKNFEVIVLDNFSLGHREAVDKGALIEKVDLADKLAIKKVFDKHRPDAVIDFAAFTGVGESMEQPLKYLKNNIFNFLNLLETMIESDCKYLIKSSSCALYGNPAEKDFPVKEDYHKHHHLTKSQLLEADFKGQKLAGEELFQKVIFDISKHLPEDLQFSNCNLADLRVSACIYALTKMADEILMKKFQRKYKLNSLALRYFNAVGADDKGDIGEDHTPELALIPNVILGILGHKPFTLFGTDYPTPDGTVIRDYIHVNDLADAHISALKYLENHPGYDIFNLGNGQGFSVLEIIKEAEKQSGRKLKINFGPHRIGDAVKIYGDNSKAQRYLNFKPKYDLTKIISTAIRWHAAHPQGYASLKSKVQSQNHKLKP